MTFSVRVHLLLFLVKHTKDSNQSQASKGKFVMKKGITKKKKKVIFFNKQNNKENTREKKLRAVYRRPLVAESL